MIDTIENAVIELSPAEVAVKLQAYRAQVKAHATRTDKLMLSALRAAKKGRRIFDLQTVMGAAGLDAQNRPRLAIARADWEDVECEREWSGREQIVSFRKTWRQTGQATRVNVPRSVFPALPGGIDIPRGRARVPLVPPAIRPIDALENYWVLWEAEWKDMPRDPYLLKRIDASLLFAIIAQWDLTELERMVMRSVYRAPRR